MKLAKFFILIFKLSICDELKYNQADMSDQSSEFEIFFKPKSSKNKHKHKPILNLEDNSITVPLNEAK